MRNSNIWSHTKALTIKRLAEGDDLFFPLKFKLNILGRLRKIDPKVKTIFFYKMKRSERLGKRKLHDGHLKATSEQGLYWISKRRHRSPSNCLLYLFFPH